MLEELERAAARARDRCCERYDAFRDRASSSRRTGWTPRSRPPSRAAAAARSQHISAAARRELHRRVRHRQELERLQLVSGQLPQPDPGQHRPADLRRPRHRSRLSRGLSRPSRLQRAAREDLVRDRGWLEFSVYPLFSPQSLIAEGTANYGIEVAFPHSRAAGSSSARDLSGRRVSTRRASTTTTTVLALVDRLSYAGNEAARRYLDGKIDAAAAADVARALRTLFAAARAAAHAVHRPVPQLRDQLQPRQGHGGALHRVAVERRRGCRAPLGGVHATRCRRRGCPSGSW